MLNNSLTKANRLVAILLVILLISSILSLFQIIILTTRFSGNDGIPFRLYILWASIITAFLLTTACVVLIWLNIKTLNRTIRLLTSEKETLAADKQKETETLTNMVSNLSTLYSQAVEHDNLKTEFFSNISHELRTPLSVILGAIQLIESGFSNFTPPSKIQKHLRTIKQNCFRLLRLINNVLDTTRIESGYDKMNLTNCNIVYMVEEMVQSVTPYAEEKNIHIEFDTSVEEIITAIDIDKMERIMLNLLSNAIKFTPHHGNIWIGITTDLTSIKITVKDTGPGIPDEMQAFIFQRFRQVNSSLTRQYEGSGIGLSLVKSFVELHNGNVQVFSKENEGSEFIVELPLCLCEGDSETDGVRYWHDQQNKVIQTIHIEFSDIYGTAS